MNISKKLIKLTVQFFVSFIHGENNFVETSKNLVGYKSEDNFVWIGQIIM